MRTGKKKLAMSIAVYAAVAIVAVWFGVFYFSVKAFELDFHKYRKAEETGRTIRYASSSGPPVVVHADGTDRTLTIDGQDYRIREEEQPFGKAYQIRYPDGKTCIFSAQNDILAYDEHGELVMTRVFSFGPDGERIRFKDESIRYHPVELVHAANPQYHETRGNPWLYALSLVMFLFAWANFRYEPVQRAMFWLSLQWIWVEHPEPNEFYFFMCKVGGIVGMLLSFVLFLQSLSKDYIALVL